MSRVVVLGGLVVATTFVAVATIRDARTTADASVPAPPQVRVPGTSRDQLALTVKEMSARVAANADDGAAVARLTESLLRLQRVNQDERAGRAALDHLEAFLSRHPNHYEAGRLHAATLVSQHRFAEGIARANKLIARDPRDAVTHGIAADAYIELGDYDRGFAVIDRMGALQPGPPAYARAAYALELKGDLQGAVEYMQRAAEGTTPNDAESQAWHFSQVGMLWVQLGRHGDATREFERALATFPNYPLAIEGMARVRVALGEHRAARKLYQEQLARTPASHLAAAVGDLSAVLGDDAEALRYRQMAEQIERAAFASTQRQPQQLARLLLDLDRDLPAAIALAEDAASRQRDIFTLDTLAWARFKAGRNDDARNASGSALRTGSRDARLLYHAAAIRNAAGDAAGARAALAQLPSRAVADVAIAEGVRQLDASLRQ